MRRLVALRAVRILLTALGLAWGITSSVKAEDVILENGFEEDDVQNWSLFTAALTIHDLNGWCSYQVEGSAFSAQITFVGVFASKQLVNLFAQPFAVPVFAFVYWTGTDNDHGFNDPNQTTTVTMNAPSKDITVRCAITGDPL